MESWVFSLALPFEEQKFARLVAQHEPTESRGINQSPSRVTGTDNDSGEIESLLVKDQGSTSNGSSRRACWTYETPSGRSIKSYSLLQLSYRPAWQGIPEYTATQRRRQLVKAVTSCCKGNHPTDLQQTLEVYTTQHIVKVEETIVTIRGMGQCDAIQVFLRAMYHTTDDDGDQESTLDQSSSANTGFASAWQAHSQRMGQGMTSNQDQFPRYSQSKDSLPLSGKSKEFIVLTFALPKETETKYDPPLLWKVQLPPSMQLSHEGLQLDTITVLNGALDLKEPATHAFIQGYQSWSYTGSIWKGQPQPKPALPGVFSRAFNLGGTMPRKPTRVSSASNNRIPFQPTFYNSDFFTCISTGRDQRLDEHGGPALVCGWLSQHEQFGLVAIDANLSRVALHASHDAQLSSRGVETDWAYGQLIAPHNYDEEPMVHYLHAAAAYNEAQPLQNGPLLTGWCSWYHYYENITEENLRSNFSKLSAMANTIPTNVAVVDDGYMTAWGDWASFKPGKFDRMEVVAKDIVNNGMTPGIWLAPFACDKHSKVAREHPEWIIRNDKGKPANSSNCGKFFYGLDATNPQVRQHVAKAIGRAVHEWGFKVLKIDFLYAACLEGNGKYDLTITRAQAMHLALSTIREAAGPDVFLIGCGCPVATGIGYVDGMRVSADTGPSWYPALPLPWWDHSTLPALRAMIRNSLSRAPYGHRWWHNDPDCLLLGESTSLTDDEVVSAASIIAMTCGMMLLSDDLTKVSPARMEIVTKIFPMTGVSAIVLDLHTTQNKGLPSILRLWCTDQYQSRSSFRESMSYEEDLLKYKHNAEATFSGRNASYQLDEATPHPNERKRSCINVVKGLGTWTVLSVSNWQDTPKVVDLPKAAVGLPPSTGWGSTSDLEPLVENEESGFHVFCFWASKYSWVSASEVSSSSEAERSSPALSRKLGPHATEIFHIRAVSPGLPQYIGSDFHFSCGREVFSFDHQKSPAPKIEIRLKSDLKRSGSIFVFVPVADTSHMNVLVGGRSAKGLWSVVGNVPSHSGSGGAPSTCIGRVVRIKVNVKGDDSENDGRVLINY